MIPLPYKLLGVAIVALGLVLGAYFKGRADVNAAWELEKVEAANDALREKNRLEAQYRAREAAQALETRNLEADYAERLVAVETDRGAFERRISDRLRAQTRRADNCELSRAAAAPGSPESPVPAGDGELGRIDPGAVSRVRTVGKQTQELLTLCRKWATSVGR